MWSLFAVHSVIVWPGHATCLAIVPFFYCVLPTRQQAFYCCHSFLLFSRFTFVPPFLSLPRKIESCINKASLSFILFLEHFLFVHFCFYQLFRFLWFFAIAGLDVDLNTNFKSLASTTAP